MIITLQVWFNLFVKWVRVRTKFKPETNFTTNLIKRVNFALEQYELNSYNIFIFFSKYKINNSYTKSSNSRPNKSDVVNH